MKKNGLILIEAIIIGVVVAILTIILALQFLQFNETPTIPKVLTEKDYPAVSDGKKIYSLYNFPSADEFEESPFYSIVWIGESAWAEKRFLLVQVKLLHGKYGGIPYLIRAEKDVRKKYNIISKTSVQIVPSHLAYTDGFLLEVEPK